jgi:tetratricopeptide (TPR) repeat protein
MRLTVRPERIPDSRTKPTRSRAIRLAVTLCISAFPIYGHSEKAIANWTGETLKGLSCRGNSQGFGPFDYLQRSQFAEELAVVEEHHFTPKVQALEFGQEGTVAGDLDYTLRAWPNHHRALVSLMQYAIQKKQPPPLTPVECYLQRAISFSPNDPTPRLLYAIHLHKHGYKQKALDQYKTAEAINPNNPELQYNLGLLLVSMKKYDEARNYALKAYRGGYPLPGLKKKLARLGYWDDKRSR